MYAKSDEVFIIFTLLAFLAVMFYLDILRYILGRDYWVGLKLYLLSWLPKCFMGILFQSFFFGIKLIDENKMGELIFHWWDAVSLS